MMNIKHIYEPTPLQCGQAVLSMITGVEVALVARELNNEKETTLKEMMLYLENKGFGINKNRIEVIKKEELPPLCLLSLETPKCWHWSLYCDGVFYDPEHGVLSDFPLCNRKYYWEISA